MEWISYILSKDLSDVVLRKSMLVSISSTLVLIEVHWVLYCYFFTIFIIPKVFFSDWEQDTGETLQNRLEVISTFRSRIFCSIYEPKWYRVVLVFKQSHIVYIRFKIIKVKINIYAEIPNIDFSSCGFTECCCHINFMLLQIHQPL